jgi:radical SAM superfamily enzyme YgiQ (UPF0313 family)
MKTGIKIALTRPFQETLEVMPPLGLGYLASAVKDIAEVSIIDCIRDKIETKELIQKLIRGNYDIIGFQCFTVDFNSVKFLVENLKRLNPKAIYVLGGPHPTLDPINTLKEINADYIFMGDSEESFSNFVRLIKNKKLNNASLKKIPGIAYRTKKGIKTNAIVFPCDLDKYNPSYDLLHLEKYPSAPHGVFHKQSPTAPIIITRGCPFNCTYCGGPMVSGKRIRSHSVNYVINQIEFLVKKYGIREIDIEDDNFTMNQDFVEEFCKKLIAKNLGITWTCPNGVRLDTLNEELLRLMKKSGCYSLFVGIESGSDRIRKHMRKNLDTKTIEEKVKSLRKVGIEAVGFFIIGYPEETIDDINKSIDLAIRLDLKRAAFNTFKPFPGTEIYDQLVRRGELPKLDYSKFSFDDVIYAPKSISLKTMKKLNRKAYLKFYFRPKIMLKMLGEIKRFEDFRFMIRRIFIWVKRW